jgi:hypothetical protein
LQEVVEVVVAVVTDQLIIRRFEREVAVAAVLAVTGLTAEPEP